MKLIVGLGNPGREYKNTYHNLGFMAIDRLADKLGISINKSKFNGLYGEGKYNGEIIFLIKPLTYMNLSGQTVAPFAKYYKLAPSDIIVLCDDIDTQKGQTRYRERGSGGTHNGLKNIVYMLGSQEFKRIKIGSYNDTELPLIDYVLSTIDEENMAKISPAIDEAIEKTLSLIGK